MHNSSWQNLREIYDESGRLLIFRSLLQDKTVSRLRRLLFLVSSDQGDANQKEKFFFDICADLVNTAEQQHLEGNLWHSYLVKLIAENENPFSRTCARHGREITGSSLFQGALHDVRIIKRLYHLNFADLVSARETSPIIENFNVRNVSLDDPKRPCLSKMEVLNDFFAGSSEEDLALALVDFYHKFGCGVVGMFDFFRWEEGRGLVGVCHPDPVRLADLIGYQWQKEIIIKNTEAFIEGKKANNLLLYGDRGTGKSSTIKALVNEYSARGLRLVEVSRHQLHRLLEIVRPVSDYAQKFIIFIDDLSFEGAETDYKFLKALMEGGVEVMPDNVLIYATSNRRHLVQETWQDRGEAGGEIHAGDSLAEKLSLSDRFGLTVTFTSPDQEEYLSIVEGLAQKQGLDLPASELRERALKWERWHNTRSGRTAQQFINHLLSTL